jgi:hypothetical protein
MKHVLTIIDNEYKEQTLGAFMIPEDLISHIGTVRIDINKEWYDYTEQADEKDDEISWENFVKDFLLKKYPTIVEVGIDVQYLN